MDASDTTPEEEEQNIPINEHQESGKLTPKLNSEIDDEEEEDDEMLEDEGEEEDGDEDDDDEEEEDDEEQDDSGHQRKGVKTSGTKRKSKATSRKLWNQTVSFGDEIAIVSSSG